MIDVVILNVLLHDQRIGTITRLPDDKTLFAFDTAYIEDEQRATLSLSFKDAFGALLTDTRTRQTRLDPFFSNLLPEGALRDYLAAKAHVNADREFFLAWVLGHDLPGAIQILPVDPDSMPPQRDADHAPPRSKQAFAERVLRFSLAGVQLKFSAVQKTSRGLTIPADGVGGSWIVKLPSPKFEGVPENEYAMMELARRVGIDVPETQLYNVRDIKGLPPGIELAGETAFAVKRFDRGPDNQRIHIEDFAQVFGVYPERKYERASYRSIAKVLWIETGEAGIVEFVRRLAFNALIGNADMHLKNWSLMYPNRRTARLAPAYDYVSTIAYLPDDKMALTLVDSKAFASVSSEAFRSFAAKAGLPEKITLDAVEQSVVAFAAAWRNREPQCLADRTRRAIDRHLRTLPLWKEFTK